MKRIVPALVALSFLLAPATVAFAQTGRHVAVGVEIGAQQYLDGEDFESKEPGFALLYRVRLSTGEKPDGVKFEPNGSVGISRARTQLRINGSPERLGRLRSIPVLVGGGPSWRLGPTSVGLSAMGGYSFNEHDLDDNALATFPAIGIPLQTVEAKNAFAAKVSLGAWHDLSSRFGVHGSLGYLFHRPKMTTTIGDIAVTEEWHGDRLSLDAGIAVGLF